MTKPLSQDLVKNSAFLIPEVGLKVRLQPRSYSSREKVSRLIAKEIDSKEVAQGLVVPQPPP
jgi:hypothetical protein